MALFNLLTYIFTLLLITLIWISGGPEFRFDKLSQIEASFPGQESDWSLKGEKQNALWESDGVIVSPVLDNIVNFYKSYQLPSSATTATYITVEGVIKQQDYILLGEIETIDAVTEPSIFYIWFQNSEAERIWIQIIAELEGQKDTNEHREFSAVINVPEDAVSIHAGLLLRRFDAGYKLSSLTIELVENSSLYTIIFYAIAVLIAGYIVFLIIKTVPKNSWWVSLSIIALIGVLICGVYLPGNTLEQLLARILGVFQQSVSGFEQKGLASFNKIAHVVGFAFVAYLVLSLKRNLDNGYVDLFIKMFLFVVFTESIQRHAVDRNPSLNDVALDVLGISLGAFIWFSFYRFQSASIRNNDVKN